MPIKYSTVCNHPGCNAIAISDSRYCNLHIIDNKELIRKNFDLLKKKSSQREIDFYNSVGWKNCSIQYRKNNTLCKHCYDKGIISISQMVHHNPPLLLLLEKGLNPFSDKCLVSLCNNCHLEELRKKRIKKY